MSNYDILRWLLGNTRTVRLPLLLLITVGALSTAAALSLVYASKKLIDLSVSHAPESEMWHYAILLLLALVSGIFFRALSARIGVITEITMQNRLRLITFSRMLEGLTEQTATMHSGQIQSRMDTDLRNLSAFLCISFPAFVVNILRLTAVFIFFQMMNPLLAWLSLLGIGIFLSTGTYHAGRIRSLTHRVREQESALLSLTQESMQFRQLIKVFVASPAFQSRLEALQHELYSTIAARARFTISSKILLSLGFSTGYFLALIWGAWQLRAGTIGFGLVAAYLQMTAQLQKPLLELLRFAPSFVTVMASAERLCQLHDILYEPQGQSIRIAETPALCFDNVSFAYEGRFILNGFSCRIPPGSRIALTGGSGMGKTTLLHLILAIYRPETGSIKLSVAGESIPVSPVTRDNFAYVPQGNTLFSGTIRENLLMGNSAATQDQMYAVLHVAAADFVRELPEGLDTLCAEKGGGLSEGQAQRICIARALLRPGNILLLDEITSALDNDTAQLVMRRLNRFAAEKTIIYITHRADMLEEFRIIRLSRASEN